MYSKLSICFPHMGDYHIAVKQLFSTLFPGQRVFSAPVMTKKTIELGSRYSPDYICSPFKYNIGNYIEALEGGANVLLQTGMGCRYGYYGEIQEQILRDLGYEFTFICFSREKARLIAAYKTIVKLGSPISYARFIFAMLLAIERISIIDRFSFYMRENIGFEEMPGSFEKLKRKLLADISNDLSFMKLQAIKVKYIRAIKRMNIHKPKQPLMVGIIGELYTLMEPFSNFYLENELAKKKISVSRIMSISFLLFGKHDKRTLKQARGYLDFTVGANGVDSVAQCKKYAELGYDGIIHMKSFGCTPEINAMPSLMNIARDYQIPILHLSFDMHTSETGVQTRIEAFSDMIAMRREKKDEKTSLSGRRYRINFNKGSSIRR